MASKPFEFRKDAFKAKGPKPDDVRRRREEASIEIRKQKRDENKAKRRNMPIILPDPEEMENERAFGGRETVVTGAFFFLEQYACD